jgi:hypothetical protein
MNTKTLNKTKNNTSTQELQDFDLKVNSQNSNSVSAHIKTISFSKGGENT